MKKQYLIGVVTGMIVVVCLVALTAMKNKSSSDKDAEEKVELVRDYLLPEAKNKELKYEGVVSDRRDPNSGRKKYVSENYAFYYDSAGREVRYILRDNTDTSMSAVQDSNTLRKKADGLLAIIKTPDLVKKCEVRTEQDAWGVSYYYDLVEKDIHVSVGYIHYLLNGELLGAAFQNTTIPTGIDIKISDEEALRIAKKEAEDFMKEKNVGEYSYIFEQELVTKQLILGEVYIVCEMEYLLDDLYGVSAYFNIRIDPSTGRIIENANSLS